MSLLAAFRKNNDLDVSVLILLNILNLIIKLWVTDQIRGF